MAEVLRATDRSLGTWPSKCSRTPSPQDLDLNARFEREAKTLASPNHPDIATIHGLEKADGLRAFVMAVSSFWHTGTTDGPAPIREHPSMLRLAADENFNGNIVRGLLRRNPKLDIVRVQDVGLSGPRVKAASRSSPETWNGG